MPDLVLAKPLTLTLDDGSRVSYPVGVHKGVDKAVTDHWYTQFHVAPDGKLPPVAESAPLTHEERVSMKAALDTAGARVAEAQAEAQIARDERDAIKGSLTKLTDENVTLKGRIASLEADLDKATKPAVQPVAAAKQPGK